MEARVVVVAEGAVLVATMLAELPMDAASAHFVTAYMGKIGVRIKYEVTSDK